MNRKKYIYLTILVFENRLFEISYNDLIKMKRRYNNTGYKIAYKLKEIIVSCNDFLVKLFTNLFNLI